MMQFLYVFRLVLFISGCLGFVVVNRYFSDDLLLYSSICFTLMILSVGILIYFIKRSSYLKQDSTETKKSLLLLLLWKIILILSCVLYLLYDYKLQADGGSFFSIEKILLALWVGFGIWGVFLGFWLESSCREVSRAFSKTSDSRKYLDYSRVKKSALYACSLTLVLCISILMCYATYKKDKTFDLSYLKIATPSSETISYLSNLKDVGAEIYFSKDNEVKPYVEKYFSILSSKVSGFWVEYIDLDLSPTKAKERDITQNGFVIFVDRAKDRINKLYVKDEINESRKILKNFDSRVLQNVKELVENSKTIYLTSSHMEASIKEDNKDKFKSFKNLSKLFSQINYNVKTLNTSELISGVPEDANCLMVLAPKSSFLTEEVASIDKYLNRGGCLVGFFDSLSSKASGSIGSARDNLVEYFKSKGLVYNKVVLANEKNHVQFTHSGADNWFLATNNFSRNDMLAPLLAARQQAFIIMFASGYFNFTPFKEGWSFSSLLKTLPSTFIDKNLNYRQDPSESTDNTFDLVVTGTKQIELKDQTESKDKKEAKVLLFSNSSSASDALIENVANQILLVSSFRWAFSDDSMLTSSSSEEDVRIQHTKKENIVWFYLTVCTIPFIILLIGFVVLRVMRRK